MCKFIIELQDTKFLKSIKLFLIPLNASPTFLSSSISSFISLTSTFGIMLTNWRASNNKFVIVSITLIPLFSANYVSSPLLSSSNNFSFYKLTSNSLILFLFSSDMRKHLSGSMSSKIYFPQSLINSAHSPKNFKSSS